MESNSIIHNQIIRKSRDETFIIIIVSIILSLGSYSFYLYARYFEIPDKVIKLTIPTFLQLLQKNDQDSIKKKISHVTKSGGFAAIWIEDEHKIKFYADKSDLPKYVKVKELFFNVANHDNKFFLIQKQLLQDKNKTYIYSAEEINISYILLPYILTIIFLILL
ncbi:hypothetical protein [Fluviispira vulneris]|uniref:hypothetical protein n=1 Tax=Fluviispira vulneris TaxID=2763012 RepID=UPI001647606C|nr:hypothetical protein [Fluviispira vulneris]